MDRKNADAVLWLLAVAGIVLGVIVAVPGVLFLNVGNGPGVLVVGLILLAVGFAALFVRLGAAARRQ